jgi:hypothetical protein
MKNSLINRNTTILVLIILVLGFIFMNLENDKSMSGGSVDCSAFIPIVKKLIAKDSIYSYTIGSTPGFIIYIILIIILLYFAIAYVRYQVYLEGYGIPGQGNTGGLTILDYAKMSLFKFYLVRNDTYFYNSKTAGSSGTTTPADSQELLNLVNVLKTPSFKPIVDNFCEALAPCKNSTPCACPGSINCNSNTQHFMNVIEHLDSPGGSSCEDPSLTPAQKALCYKLQHAEQFYGIIPKCCCVLSQQNYSDAAGAKKGQPNPNYGKLLGACSNGAKTAEGIKTAISESKTDSKGDLPSADDYSACDATDCSNEPDYTILEEAVYGLIEHASGNSSFGINPSVLEKRKSIVNNIIQNTPSETLNKLFQMSTFNTPGNPNASIISTIIATPGLGAPPGISTRNEPEHPSLVNHLTNQIIDGLSAPSINNNSALKPAPNPPSVYTPPLQTFTGKVPKSAKKIRKNKK